MVTNGISRKDMFIGAVPKLIDLAEKTDNWGVQTNLQVPVDGNGDEISRMIVTVRWT